jgi:rod shape-determining protein MreD
MIMYYLKWPLLFIGCFILQMSFVPAIAVWGVKPDLLMIALFFFSIRYGIIPGMLVGFTVGCAQDVYAPAILGQYALCKTLIGAAIGCFNVRVMRTDALVKTLILFAMFFLHDALFMGILVAKHTSHMSMLFIDLFVKTVPRALYSALLAALFLAWEIIPKPAGLR